VIREEPFHYMVRGSGQSHARLLRFGWAYLKTIGRMLRLRQSPNPAAALVPCAVDGDRPVPSA
jgi:hypothetical protein